MLSEWAGLGYYARARNLIACARAGRQAWRRFPRDEASLRGFPASAPIRRRRSRRSPSAGAAAVDTNVERVVAGCSRRPSAGKARDPRIAAAAGSPPSRAGDFAQAMMDLGATICRPRRRPLAAAARWPATAGPSGAATPERFPPPRRQGAAARARHRLVDRARRLRLAGPPPGEGHARRNGGAARPDWGPTSPPMDRAPAGHAMSSPISRWTWRLCRTPGRRRGLVAAARPARRSRPADPLPARPSRRSWRKAPLPPEPFFTGPGLDRADLLRLEPERLPSWRRAPARRQLVWPTASGARRGWPARLEDGSATVLFLGLDGEPRSRRSGSRGRRAQFGCSASNGDAPLCSPARSASPIGIAAIFCSVCGATESSAAAGRGAARMRRRAFPARRPGRHHAGRA